MPTRRILVVDDEAGIRFGVGSFLRSHGYEVEEAENAATAQALVRASRPDAVIMDYLLPDGTALDLLPSLKEMMPSMPVIILTGHGSIELAVRAVKQGADQFLTKPVELPALLTILERAVENQRNRQKQLAGKSQQSRAVLDPFSGTSPTIRRLADEARKVASTESSVLVQGETGTGKGVLAGWLHAHGPRAEEAFVDMNCAGLSQELLESELFGHERGAFTGATATKSGLLEIAHRGTMFLDEIGDMDLHVQSKLLKVLEEKRFRRLGDVRDRQVDVRLIAATHQDLPALIREKRFRSDLYFRISTIPITVPPLRERVEDIPILARGILERFAVEWGRVGVKLSGEAERALQAYAWPGNVRELRNALERAVLLCDRSELTPTDLAFEAPAPPGPGVPDSDSSLRDLELRHIQRLLREERGHVGRAAARLGIPRSSLYYKLKKAGIPLSKG
ncbi:MAG TPA: sigma-54 dependent transcriptional regulator [Candidatus Sulfotelmatobacter sp.]|nr:sigma-54 dependent transcriptional regulator [Candidatus Sulfotelmatobacter sp.]